MKRTTVPFRHCPRCANKGLIRVNYHDGEPFDMAICDCQSGQYWRHQDDIEAAVRARLLIDATHQVALVEDFGLEPVGAAASTAAFTDAGKVGKRAKL